MGRGTAFSMHTEMGVCAVSIKSLGERQVNLGEVHLKINPSQNFSANMSTVSWAQKS